MSKWVFRLTGLLVTALLALLFLDRFLNPEVPDYIGRGVDIQTQGESKATAPVSTPDVPSLTLTSIEGDESGQPGNIPAPTPGAEAQSAPPAEQFTLSALEEAESIPVLRNPDSQRANVWLQAGSFSERANADKRAAVLKAHSWSIEIEPAVVEGKTYYRVYVGPLNHKQVNGYLDKLNAMGINAREINR